MFFCFLILVASAWGAALGAFVWVLDDAKSTIQALDEFRPKTGAKVYSADGEFMGEYATDEWRRLVPLREIPLYLQKAFVATEDDKFYQHKGVRPLAIVNGVLYKFRAGRMRGGSTITQQLVRNVGTLGVGKEVTIARKIREAITALQVERQYTKDEILELYLNQLFLGGRARGVEAASWQYFAKSCRELTLGECALMAGLARAPNKQRPDRFPERAVRRRDIVLGQMRENGMITQNEYDSGVAELLEESMRGKEERVRALAEGGQLRPNQFLAPYFVEEVRRRAERRAHVDEDELREQGLTIHTTIDMRMQRIAEDVFLPWLDEFDEIKKEYLKKRDREDEFVPVSGGLVCIDNRPGHEGYVRALVGGRDWTKEQYNTITQAKRQPGSSVKPFVWAAALSTERDNGITPSHMEVDEAIVRYDDLGRKWEPGNFDEEYFGAVTLRFALQESINIVSIKLVERIGPPTVRKFLRDAGVTTPISDHIGPTIALGTPEVTPLDQCVAYSTLAKNGTRCPPLFISEIEDREGFTRYKSRIERTPNAIPADVAYVMCHLLKGVALYGTGRRTAPLGTRPRCGKTGTTNDSRSVWFCGFTRQFTCVVWVGYRDNRPLGKGWNFKGLPFTGGNVACPPWTEFMLRVHQGMPELDFEVPEGVVFYNVDYGVDSRGHGKGTGVAGGDFKEAFLAGTAPPAQIPEFQESSDLERFMAEELLKELRIEEGGDV